MPLWDLPRCTGLLGPAGQAGRGPGPSPLLGLPASPGRPPFWPASLPSRAPLQPPPCMFRALSPCSAAGSVSPVLVVLMTHGRGAGPRSHLPTPQAGGTHPPLGVARRSLSVRPGGGHAGARPSLPPAPSTDRLRTGMRLPGFRLRGVWNSSSGLAYASPSPSAEPPRGSTRGFSRGPRARTGPGHADPAAHGLASGPGAHQLRRPLNRTRVCTRWD